MSDDRTPLTVGRAGGTKRSGYQSVDDVVVDVAGGSESHSNAASGGAGGGVKESGGEGSARQTQRMFSLPDSELVSLAWHNIDVYADIKAKKKPFQVWKKSVIGQKHILRDVSGKAEPGTLLAIMGASGAGKSTLMNVLTGRNRGTLRVSGAVTVNGRPAGVTSSSQNELTSVSAYVQQDDLFIGTLTVKEHLYFQAMLRMDRHIPHDQRMEKVDSVIRELGLEKCINTLIGIPGRLKGISGGEKKRLAFASEVLTNPRIMFCDEPTSGLDSYMAASIVSVLRQLAARGRTILCTIHQPASQLYNMFDNLLLMADGRVAFIGPAKEAPTFFASLSYECPPNFNPADFLVNTLAIVPDDLDASRQKVEAICDAFTQTPLHRGLAQSTADSSTNVQAKRKASDLAGQGEARRGGSPYKAGWFTQFRAVLWRSWLSVLREPMVIKVRTFQTVLIALILGLIYLGTEYTQEGIQNINGIMFLLITNMTFQNMFAVVNVFCGELTVFLREHYNGMYRTDVYYICKSMAELPLFIFLPVLFTAISYWMVGMYNDWEAFLICCAIITLVANVATSFGYMISTISNDVTIALSVAPPMIIPLMLFGGFFLNTESVPVYFIWLDYLSWFKYSNEAISINQWQHVTNITCSNNIGPCVTNGQQVLDSLNFNKDNLWLDIGLLGALLGGYRLIGYVALLIRATIMRGR